MFVPRVIISAILIALITQQISCQTCGPGLYYDPNAFASFFCPPCGTGKWSPGGSLTTCFICSCTTCVPTTGVCTGCSIGKFIDATQHSLCIACQAATYSPTTTATSCLPCTNCTLCSATTGVCTSCQRAYYLTQGSCNPCSNSTFSPGGSTASCFGCSC